MRLKMKSSFFYDAHHAEMYLRDCIVMYMNTPHYVLSTCQGDGRINLSIVGLKRIIRGDWSPRYDQFPVDIDSPELSFSLPKLGMINLPSGAWYISRQPRRMWKASLNDRNLRVFPTHEEQRGIKDRVIFRPEFLDMLNNVYPTVKQAAARVNHDRPTEAFHKDFCLSLEGHLRYRYSLTPVGVVDNDKKLISLNREHFYLVESLHGALEHEDYRANVR